ncbi:MAG: hypothetical protein D6812_14590, partial [Deltaproteobacteria bacterium]
MQESSAYAPGHAIARLLTGFPLTFPSTPDTLARDILATRGWFREGGGRFHPRRRDEPLGNGTIGNEPERGSHGGEVEMKPRIVGSVILVMLGLAAPCCPFLDGDGDGFCDPVDNCPAVVNPDQRD